MEEAIIPTFDTTNHYTLYSIEDVTLAPDTPYGIKTGIRVAFPKTHCAIILSNGYVKTLGGLLDSDYRGDVCVIAVSPTGLEVKKGDAIAKLMVIEISTSNILCKEVLEVEEEPVAEESPTSTGVN